MRAEAIPAGRYGTSEERAAAVVYLSSAEARYITGQQIVLDGGVSVRGPVPEQPGTKTNRASPTPARPRYRRPGHPARGVADRGCEHDTYRRLSRSEAR